MTKHGTVYWSLCLVTATTLVVCHERAATAASRMGGRQAVGAAPRHADAPLEERASAFVKSELLAKGVPSVSVAIMREGKMSLERAWGLADIEKNVSATPSTTYSIASVTKQFTAALVLKQVDRGRLTLTDPISKHFAGLSPEVGAVTIEQLLNHTSGMKRPIVDPNRRLENISAESLLENATGSKLERTPGKTWAYSNAGYTVLGVLVERLYRKSYAAALQDEIAGPLQLATLSKCVHPKPSDARGYVRAQEGKPGPAPGMHHSQSLGAGGICAAAADLVRWTHALHTGRVLSPASYQAMITPRGAAVASKYGFGLSVEPAAWGDMAIVHEGNAPGPAHTAELHWYPQHSLAVAVLSNGFPLVRGASDIARTVLGMPLAAPAATPSTAPTTPADRSTLVGVYELTPQRTFEVTLENGELFVAPPGEPKQRLIFRLGNSYWLGKSDSTTTLTFIIENGVAAGFVANNNGSKRRLRKIQAGAAGKLRLSSCAPEIATAPAECGTYTVWENRTLRRGRTIDLNIVLLRATGPSRRSDPVVYLAGGPGQAATSLARSLAGSSRRRERDILLVDQRGTGRSNGLFCGPEPTAPASEFMASFDPARAQKCARELSSRADLRHYLTSYAMNDLDEVRAALGYQTLNLHGDSYGTRAALVYLRQHGDHVRSVTLQGALAMSNAMPAGMARAAEDALEGVMADCHRDSACANSFPELRKDYQRAVSAIAAGSREYSVPDPRGGSTVTATLTPRDFAEALRGMLYAPAAARQVPLLLHQAASTGDYRRFAEFQLQRNIALAQGFAEGMYFAVTCTEDVARTDAAASYAAGHGTFLADHRARAHIESCRGWPTGVVAADFGQEVASDVPVLVITGQYDPVTPPSDARTAASRLTRAKVVIVPHGGHSVSGLTNAACVQQLMAGFLETADPNGLDTGCLAGMKRPAFAVSAAVSTQTSVGSSAPMQSPQQQERKEITVPEEILKAYVGHYEATPDLIVKITFENGSLWGERNGSAKRQMFAETQMKFFLKSSATELTFQKDEKGSVIGVIVKSGANPEMTLEKVK